MTALLMSPRLAHEVELNALGKGAELLAAPQQLGYGLPTFLAVIARVFVHVHPDEAIGVLGSETAPEPDHVLHRLRPVLEAGLNRLETHRGGLVTHLWTEVAHGDVDPQ